MTERTKSCFAVMPFDAAFDDVFEHAIERAATRRGYRCHRADRAAGAINLIEAMIHHIFEADLVIADLTGGNMNVLYELGIAHSCCERNKTLMIAEDGSRIPFDVRPYHVVLYDRSYGGIKSLREKLAEHIDFLADAERPVANPVQDYLESRERGSSLEFLPTARPTASAGSVRRRLSRSWLELGLLSFLETTTGQGTAPSLTEICHRLDIRSRKAAFETLQALSADGLIERADGAGALWRLSERGRTLLHRLRPVARIKIETEVD